MAQSFEDWLDEIEVFSARRERAHDDLGPRGVAWLRAAWVGGMAQAEAAVLETAPKVSRTDPASD